MGQQLHELFMASCGVFGQWGVRVLRKDSVAEDHSLPFPYAIVGNHDKVTLHLSDPEVSRRHAYLQVLPGGLFCTDLDSRAGVLWGDEKRESGWIRPSQRVHIGSYALELLATNQDSWLAPSHWPHSNPLIDRMNDAAPLPSFVVEVAHAGVILGQGRMNRVMALVGRSPRCLFYINNPALSKFHCSLVRTPMGLWVVDLLSRAGTCLNGRHIRFAWIQEEDVIHVGKLSLRFRHQYRNAKVIREVAAGTVPVREADDRCSTARLPVSSMEERPVPPPAIEQSTALEPMRSGAGDAAAVTPRAARTMMAAPDERVGAEWSMLVALVSQFNLMQQQMFDQFHESMLMTSRMFTSLHHDQMAVVREELDQLRGITGELRALQDQLTGQQATTNPPVGVGSVGLHLEPIKTARPETRRADGMRADAHGDMANGRKESSGVADPAAKPVKENGKAGPVAPPPAESPEDVHVWLNQRISALHEERQTRWHKLLGLILGN